MTYRCAICGAEHGDLPDIGSDRPDHWWGVAKAERAARISLDRAWEIVHLHDPPA